MNLIKRSLAGSFERNYYSAKAYYKYRLRRFDKQFELPPLLIYQMGKVGSSSVQQSLKTYQLNRPVYHVHFLTDERITQTEKDRRKYFRTDDTSYKRPWLYQHLRKRIAMRCKGQKWKVITLVRDPIARNISTFFENLTVKPLESHDTYQVDSEYYSIPRTIIKMNDLNELINLFNRRLDHTIPLVFFDREIKAVFGVDVFEQKFPKSTGYQVYSAKTVDVLLIRLESLNQCAANAFKTFLGIEDFKLENKNVGDKKAYAEIYNIFKENIIIPDSYLDQMYNSRFAKHFYTDEEIDEFKKKWQR